MYQSSLPQEQRATMPTERQKLVYRDLILKKELMDNNELWKDGLEEIKKRAWKQTHTNFKQWTRGYRQGVLPLIDCADEMGCMRIVTKRGDEEYVNASTNSTLFYFPEVQQTYVMVPLVTYYQDDYWKIVYANGVPAIISLFEKSEPKDRMFPTSQGEKMKTADILIKCLQVTKTASYVLRVFTLEKNFDERKLLHHYEFSDWQELANPDSQKLIELQKDYQRYHRTVVSSHDSSELGRAGAFIIFDVLFRMLFDSVEHEYCVERMVQEVSRKKSYAFIHWEDYRFIYTHLIVMLEHHFPCLKSFGNDVREYAKSVPLEPKIPVRIEMPRIDFSRPVGEREVEYVFSQETLKKFMSPSKWCPDEEELEKQLDYEKRKRMNIQEKIKKRLT